VIAVANPHRGQSFVSGAAIQGRRSEQQDSYDSVWLPAEKAWLLLLADGMGGHADGGLASKLAVERFASAFAVARSAEMGLRQAFEAALERANAQIAAEQRDRPERESMGTTLVAAHLSSNGVAWISVGDSPLWLYRGNSLYRLNEDHSLRALAREGAKVSGNMLQSALNGHPVEIVDCQDTPIALYESDLLLLASDGLLTLDEKDIAGEIGRNARNGSEAVAQALLNAVEQQKKDNQDNCTVILASPQALAGNATAAAFSAGKTGRFPLRVLAAAIAAALAGSALYFLFA